MPPVSLVVCIYKERELLARLLHQSADCYDDLVVVHDGPEDSPTAAGESFMPVATDFSEPQRTNQMLPGYRCPPCPPVPGSAHELVERYGGRFFEHPRIGSLEGQSPFAWSQAKHDWILRLDADEFPSEELKTWLQEFRRSPAPDQSISGFTCIWPLWNGEKALTKNWPSGRIFLFNRSRVRFFGLIEQVPIPEGSYVPVNLVLHHQPKRRSYGIRNILFRPQAGRWRRIIALSLLGKPTDLPRWRWSDEQWPLDWERVRTSPLKTGLIRLFWFPLCQARSMLKAGAWPRVFACLNGGIHHFLIGVTVLKTKMRRRNYVR